MKYETTTSPVSAKFAGTKKELDSILVVGKDFDLRFVQKKPKSTFNKLFGGSFFPKI